MLEQEKLLREGKWDELIPIRGEELLVAKRQHGYIILLPVIAGFFLTIISLGITSYILIHVLYAFFLATIANLTIVNLALLWTSKLIIDWSYHVYIVTNHKILEIKYAPLSTHVINEVLLDQVRCAEVNVHADGIIGELIDMGNVSIQFDWAYHQQEVTFYNIKNARYLGSFLSSYLGNTAIKNNPVATGYTKPNSIFPLSSKFTFPTTLDIFSSNAQIAA